MTNENNASTIRLQVSNEYFELSSSVLIQLIEYSSSSSDFIVSIRDKHQQIYLDIDPCIFNAYILYVQSGYFVRPAGPSHQDLISALRICGAPLALINHYDNCDLTSVLSSHEYSSSLTERKYRTQQICFNTLLLAGFFIASCSLIIDLYRQILILNKSTHQETSQFFIIIIYSIDSILFLYSIVHTISKFISSNNKKKQLTNNQDIIMDIISSLG